MKTKKKSKKFKKQKYLRLGKFIRLCNISAADPIMLQIVEYSRNNDTHESSAVRIYSFDSYLEIPTRFMMYEIRDMKLGYVTINRTMYTINGNPPNRTPMFIIRIACPPKMKKKVFK